MNSRNRRASSALGVQVWLRIRAIINIGAVGASRPQPGKRLGRSAARSDFGIHAISKTNINFKIVFIGIVF